MRRTHSLNLLAALVLLLALLASCGDQPEAAEPTPAPAAAQPAEEAPAAQPAEEAPAAAQPPKGTDVAGEPVGGLTVEGVTTSGVFVADLGFRPATDGFGFANYGADPNTVNLTPADVRRLFGDEVCASLEGDACLLTPAGEQWMQEQNQGMSGGHCEGMAVVSKLIYSGQINAADFGAESTAELTRDGNEALQREIAYWFTTQATLPARDAILNRLTPTEVVNTLIDVFNSDRKLEETYAIGFYKRDRSGGHAVTPFAIEDRGQGVFWILIYDNNYPGQMRAIEVDTNANTWVYDGSSNPEIAADTYEGDAESLTLELAPIPPRLQQQFCPFCAESATARVAGGSAAPEQLYNQIWFDGEGDLLITDGEGRRYGYADGQFVNEIPGAKSHAWRYGVAVWDNDNAPAFYMPVGIDFTMTIDGSRLEEPSIAAVTMVGPGYTLEISDIMLDPGQVDTLDVSPDGSFLSYLTETGESPDILVGIETPAADYTFYIKGMELEAGGAVNVTLDTAAQTVALDTIDNTEDGSYLLALSRIDDQGEQIFGGDELVLEPDDVAYMDYALWEGNQDGLPIDIDRGGDGEVDETFELLDITDEIEE
ncbi:MAG: hypothetical protein RLZZ387_1325 [Chloroflexota bacterium]